MNKELHHKTVLRRSFNRILHIVAQFFPGGSNLRPVIHRMRGSKIGENVFIAEQVYLDGEYPECIEIGDNVEIAPRVNIISHRMGPGNIIIKENVFIGMGANIAAEGGKTVIIGECSVIGMGSVINSDVPPWTFVAGNPAKPIRLITVPLTGNVTMEQFRKGLKPIAE